MRVGLGYDIHRVCHRVCDHVRSHDSADSAITLGGLQFDCDFSLDGHSDADVILHAITDAILGALGDHDIGFYFPSSETINRGRRSADFIVFARNRMLNAGYKIANIDCNVICEQPKINPIRNRLIESVAGLLAIEKSRVNIKGRTNEKLDSVGRGEAIICQAVVLMETI